MKSNELQCMMNLRSRVALINDTPSSSPHVSRACRIRCLDKVEIITSNITVAAQAAGPAPGGEQEIPGQEAGGDRFQGVARAGHVLHDR